MIVAAIRSFPDDLAAELILDRLSEEGFFRRKRTRREATDYWQTPWGQLILNPNTRSIETSEGKLFRRRFRLPFPVYVKLLER